MIADKGLLARPGGDRVSNRILQALIFKRVSAAAEEGRTQEKKGTEDLTATRNYPHIYINVRVAAGGIFLAAKSDISGVRALI